VSVAGKAEKRKFYAEAVSPDNSVRVEYPRRPLGQWLRAFMAFEIPQKQDQEENHNKHKKSKVVSCGI
jgi:hypothetical protein